MIEKENKENGENKLNKGLNCLYIMIIFGNF
jgi:hypothetical protein